MKLSCPNCNKNLKPAETNLAQGLGQCRNCDVVFSLINNENFTGFNGPKPKVTQVDTIREYTENNQTVLIYGRREFWRFSLVILFLTYWCYRVLRPIADQVRTPTLIDLGLIFFALPAMILLYYLLVLSFNRLKISLGQTNIRVSVGPLPFPGSRSIARQDIKQVFIEVYSPLSLNTTTEYFYRLKYLDPKAQSKMLASGFGNYSEARRVEQVIEEKLGIVDQYEHDKVWT